MRFALIAAAVLTVAACDEMNNDITQCNEGGDDISNSTLAGSLSLSRRLSDNSGASTAAEERSSAQCGPTSDFEEINHYTGEFPDVQSLEDSVALINGNCTGTLINGGDTTGGLILTAGHCTALGDETLVVFNHELCPDGETSSHIGVVIEQSLEPDFAIIELESLPDITPMELGQKPTKRLAVIQHPRGRPKVIAEGQLLEEVDGILRYVDLDTAVGGSGAGVLSTDGKLVGVHSRGDCNEFGGANAGWTAQAIVLASTILDSSVFR